ncbi:MAG: Hsp20/alpha crystallin family protein [Candidatus Brocadiaceae bacterium]|nr:Hsp20/alpha crystallin family protein [Candidatus Brocadiaceae bacterium]
MKSYFFLNPKAELLINEDNMAHLPDDSPQKLMAKHSSVEKLYEEFFYVAKSHDFASSAPWQPPTDVYETEKDIIIRIAVSGLRHEDVSVVFSDHILTVSGRRRDDSANQKVCYYQVEIRHGYFERKIKIPKHVDANNIHATYENGFILVTIPKAEQAINSTISIKITY